MRSNTKLHKIPNRKQQSRHQLKLRVIFTHKIVQLLNARIRHEQQALGHTNASKPLEILGNFFFEKLLLLRKKKVLLLLLVMPVVVNWDSTL